MTRSPPRAQPSAPTTLAQLEKLVSEAKDEAGPNGHRVQVLSGDLLGIVDAKLREN